MLAWARLKGMAKEQARSETSVALAMIELDRLERERLTLETMRREARATATVQAEQLRELESLLEAERPRAIARRCRAEREQAGRDRADAEQRAVARRSEHEARMAELERANAERRARLQALELANAEAPPRRPSSSVLEWLTPVACLALTALFGYAIVRDQPATAVPGESTHVMLDAKAPVPVEPTVAPELPASEVVIDAPVVEPTEVAVNEPVESAEPVASTKPASKPRTPSKPRTSKPKEKTESKPVTKPRKDPLVLSGGDDPLG